MDQNERNDCERQEYEQHCQRKPSFHAASLQLQDALPLAIGHCANLLQEWPSPEERHSRVEQRASTSPEYWPDLTAFAPSRSYPSSVSTPFHLGFEVGSSVWIYSSSSPAS